MNKHFSIIILLSLFGCSQNIESLEKQFSCETDAIIYFNNLEYTAKEFKVYHPRNWKLEITKNKPYTSYVFSDSIREIPVAMLGELSNEEIRNRYNEFITLTLIQDKIFEGFNYSEAWESISNMIESKNEFEILETGKALYNGKGIQWIKYHDNYYAKDSLMNLSLATCLVGESNYLTIQASVFGEKEVEKRMCKLIEIIGTITVI